MKVVRLLARYRIRMAVTKAGYPKMGAESEGRDETLPQAFDT